MNRWVKRQSYRDFTWIICTDGETTGFPELPYYSQVVQRVGTVYRLVKPEGYEDYDDQGAEVCQAVEGRHSMLNNLVAGLHVAQGDIVIMEDDEYYSRDWLSYCAEALEEVDLFGCAPAHYFNLMHNTYRCLHNVSYASLACTAWTSNVTSLVMTLVEDLNSPFIDGPLWDRWEGTKKVTDNRVIRHNVSFKGLPGTGGIGASHSEVMGGVDADHQRLKLLLPPADVKVYLPYFHAH